MPSPSHLSRPARRVFTVTLAALLAACAPSMMSASRMTILTPSAAITVPAAQTAKPGPQVVMTEYPIPTPASLPGGIVVGADKTIWFHETGANRIARLQLDGTLTEYTIPTPEGTEPKQGFLGVAPDGAVWFTQSAVSKLGRIGPDGGITEMRVPTYNSSPLGLAAGPDGAMWFSEFTAGRVGRVAPDGKITEIVLPAHLTGVMGPTVARDGALWFRVRDLKAEAFNLMRMTTDGTYTLFPLPLGPDGKVINPLRMTVGPDGAVWFAGAGASVIGRVTNDGQITTFPVADMNPVSVTTGPDGAIWFTGWGTHEIGRLTLQGGLSRYPILTEKGRPYHIVLGPDRALWFTLMDGNKIGRLEVR